MKTAFLKSLIVLCFLSVWIDLAESQEIILPNLAMKSHETLEISSIEFAGGKTIVNMVVENRREGGNFCADRNIFIYDQWGKRFRMIKAVNIPECPRTYNFRTIGEKLSFSLEFPPLDAGSEWIDIIEECNDNCFWLYGITLDAGLNKKLNEAFAAAGSGKPEENVLLFRKLLEEIDDSNHGIEGMLYINIINAALEAGDKAEASVWYKRLVTSGAPRLNFYVKYLNDRGIRY